MSLHLTSDAEAFHADSLGHPEREVLLQAKEKSLLGALDNGKSKRAIPVRVSHVAAALVGGALICLLLQISIYGPGYFMPQSQPSTIFRAVSNAEPAQASAFASSWAGSFSSDIFPPPSPTNVVPSLFPTSAGYQGTTATGVEPGMIATAPAYPYQPPQCVNQLIAPAHLASTSTSTSTTTPSPSPSSDPSSVLGFESVKAKDQDDGQKDFKLFAHWGNLSPWSSIPKGKFGVDATPDPPPTCTVKSLHFLHRHGARYPTAPKTSTSTGTATPTPTGPAAFANKLNANPKAWKATGDLEFLNDWIDLGFSLRMKYGYLLNDFTQAQRLPVFRTTSQDRMVKSAQNFAVGFFGYPIDGQYQQSIMIQAPTDKDKHQSFPNTLSPSDTPGRSYSEFDNRGCTSDARNVYLRGKSFSLQRRDQADQTKQTVALGYSKFCELFTQEEWEGFDYGYDLKYWYDDGFGSPLGRVLGLGWVQELVSRLKNERITVLNSSTNPDFVSNPVTFPLGNSFYVDATHDTVILNVITALGLSNFAASGPLPYNQIPPNRSFRTAELVPFATNMQFQVLSCDSLPDAHQIRIIINDGVVPLTGIQGCPDQKEGMCPLDTFVAAQWDMYSKTNWTWGCDGDWTLPEGW
ncbi:histidine phosphatase superfamily [Coprinopsis sp. MPI-PUGE-AT-0042]|nr:histidine phosphatase superfamily [Coprinopsis sp. MPI-PUGE-AT-0042]